MSMSTTVQSRCCRLPIQLDYDAIDIQVIDNAFVNNVVNLPPKSYVGGHLGTLNDSLGKRGNRGQLLRSHLLLEVFSAYLFYN